MTTFTAREVELLHRAVLERQDVLIEFRRESEEGGGSYGPDVFTDDINAYKTIEEKIHELRKIAYATKE